MLAPPQQVGYYCECSDRFGRWSRLQDSSYSMYLRHSRLLLLSSSRSRRTWLGGVGMRGGEEGGGGDVGYKLPPLLDRQLGSALR